ncbi:MAG: PorP/SprF family type IX secretion system membrane protein [Chitinophagaceae bacterium]
MKKYFNLFPKLTLLIGGLSLLSLTANAQLKSIAAQYFQNPYFVNPAYAGKENGLELNMAYRLKSENIQNNTSMQALTLAYKANKSGFGISLKNDQSGLLSTKSAYITYAYHLQLNNKTSLHFGASPGLVQKRFDTDAAIANDLDDPFPAEFNSRKPVFNAEFGMALTSEKFNFQVSLPNLRQSFKQTTKDEDELVINQLFYAEARFSLNDGKVEPMLAYNRFRNTDSRADMGVKVNFIEGQAGLLVLYHTDNTFSSGLNISLKQGFTLQGVYSTSRSIYNAKQNGILELALKTKLSKKK